MALESVNYQCPACSGPLAFDAVSGKLKCDYCDSTFTVEEAEAYYAAKQGKADDKAAKADQDAQAQAANDMSVDEANASSAENAAVEEGDPIENYLKGKATMAEGEGDGEALCVECSSCGAQLITTATTAVTQCPYCGNNTVVPGKLGDALEPDYVIPFKTTKQQAIDALTQHYQGKICLPKEFKDKNHIEEIQGVYVPFWLYDGEAQGTAKFTGTNVRVWSDDENEYTETETWHCTRSGSAGFSMVPADGSERMPDEHMDSIEPFDYSELKPYSVAYLPGFLADRYDQTVKQCGQRARVRIAQTLTDELEKTVVGYGSVSLDRGITAEEVDFSKVSYALFPVWMLHTRWNDQDFLFAMNGQTGKLVGDLPCDKKKLNLLTLVGAVAGLVIGALAAGIIL